MNTLFCVTTPYPCGTKNQLMILSSGNLTPRHREIFYKNPLFMGMRLPEVRETEPLEKRFPRMSPPALDLMKVGTVVTDHDVSEQPPCPDMYVCLIRDVM